MKTLVGKIGSFFGRSSNLLKEENSKLNIIVIVIIVQFIAMGFFLSILNLKINRLTQETEQNFFYIRQMLNQASNRIYQLQVDMRKRAR